MGGWVGGGWINQLQTLSQGLVLTFRFTFNPELDNLPQMAFSSSIIFVKVTFTYVLHSYPDLKSTNLKLSFTEILRLMEMTVVQFANYLRTLEDGDCWCTHYTPPSHSR